MIGISQEIKSIKNRKKITQVNLAHELHYGYTAIANYESGGNQPNIGDLTKLANTLNVSIDYLVGNSDIKCTEEREWYTKLHTKLKENNISPNVSDYILMKMIYFTVKEMQAHQKYDMDIDDFLYKILSDYQKDFNHSVFLLLQNEQYFDIVKNALLEKLQYNET
ncbi:helix-turn-helix transcriptional regulator [Lachnospiraceae bacterium 46-61]